MDPLEIRPRQRTVTMVRAELRPLPSLNINIEAQEDFAAARICLKEEGGTACVAEREIEDERRVTLTSVQPAAYVIELLLPEWTSTARADLTGGKTSTSR